MRKILSRTAFSLCLLTAVAGAVPNAPIDVFRYGRFEASFTSAKDYLNPLKEEVVVRFSGPRGVTDEVLGFWDGGRTWKVRYSPEHTGLWRYEVIASDVSDTGLNKITGQFNVTTYRGKNELYRKGSPHVSPNGRYLVQRYNKPWFWLADTAWNGPLMATADEWDRYLADRAQRKFTAVQVVMTQWRAGRQDEKGQTAFAGADQVRVNPDFFERMDARMNAINDHGLVAVPVILWSLSSKDRESPGAILPVDQATLLARYIVARYGAYSVIWFLSGDGNYSGQNAERWKTIGRAVFPKGRWHRPVSMHPQGMEDPWPEFKDEEWVDLFTYQSGHGGDAAKWKWNATEGPAAGWKLDPPHPVIDAEPNYEGHTGYHGKTIDDAAVRRAAYYSLLAAPIAGVSYGAHGIWSWARKPEVPLDHPRSGTAQPWSECLDYPGVRQMTILRDVMSSMEWWTLKPDRSLFVDEKEKEDEEFAAYPMAARSEAGSFALLYLPNNPFIELDLSSFKQDVKGIWIDPRNGLRKSAGLLRPAYGVQVRTPAPGDWLLLLRR